jgi:hypothetical protein
MENKHIERDGDGNIVSIYNNPQKDESGDVRTEEIVHDDMISQLRAQDLKWEHGYDQD